MKKAEEAQLAFSTEQYTVLRLRFLIEEPSEELDEDGDRIPWGGYSVYDFAVINENGELVEFPAAQPVLDSYRSIVQKRMDDFDLQHPDWEHSYPESLYFINTEVSE